MIVVTHAMVIRALTGDSDIDPGGVRRHVLVPDLAADDA